MPPSRCLHTLPLRTIDSAAPARTSGSTCIRSFSSSQQHQYAAAGPSKGVTTLKLKKKGRPQATAKPPEPGERKALRKRIVLSNTNALAVRVQPLNNALAPGNKPEVRALPVEHIDQLRAVEAFKPKQGWSFFQTPAVLVREETKALHKDMDAAVKQKETRRKVIVGEKSSGKSVVLLQAITMAFQQGWIVINFPEGRDLTSASTAFAPIPGTNPTQYTQPSYTAKLLKQTLTANKAVLDKIKVSEKPKLSFPVKDNITLAGLLELGQNDPERAWPVFQAFWKELNADKGKRPPVLMCMDNVAHVMVESKYQVLNEADKLVPVHAHNLVLVKHFLDLLSGAASLSNGGVILAATSASDAPRSEAMDVGIAVSETRQALKADPESREQPKVAYDTAYTRLERLNPARNKDPTALSNFYSPLAPIDTRVLSVFSPSLEVVRLQGLNQAESVALMRYWTQSGMHRGSVLPWTVGEARALSGGGVVGQLEATVVRFLQRERVGVEEAGGKKIRVH